MFFAHHTIEHTIEMNLPIWVVTGVIIATGLVVAYLNRGGNK